MFTALLTESAVSPSEASLGPSAAAGMIVSRILPRSQGLGCEPQSEEEAAHVGVPAYWAIRGGRSSASEPQSMFMVVESNS